MPTVPEIITSKEIFQEMVRRAKKAILKWLHSENAFITLGVTSMFSLLVGFIFVITELILKSSPHPSTIPSTLSWSLFLIPIIGWSIYGLLSWYKSIEGCLQRISDRDNE